MLSNFRWLMFSGLLFIVLSCNNTLDIIEEGKDIPVVYGFIDLSDTTQYIRIERAIGEEGKSAFELAKDPNNIYYNNLKVSIHVPTQNETYNLVRIDGNEEGYIRDDGPFANAPNYLYKIKTDELNLRGEEVIQLIIDRGVDYDLINSTSNVMSPIQIVDFDRKEIGWFGRNKISIKWSATSNSGIFDVSFLIRYDERQGLDGSWENKEILWKPFENRTNNLTQRLYQKEKIRANELYTFLLNNIKEDDNLYRRFDEFDLIIRGGAKELIEYRRIILANAGLTGAQELPNYSNIDGGLGIFSSKYTAISEGHYFNEPSTDTLNARLKSINFVRE